MDLYYLTRDQIRTLHGLDEDLAVRGYSGDAEGVAIEAIKLLPEEEDYWVYEVLLIAPDGEILTTTKLRELE